MRTAILFVGIGSLIASATQGQPPDAGARAAMKKLEFLAGTWRGKAVITFGDRRLEATGTETATFKQQGLVLVVEGNFSAKVGPKGETRTVHDALGVISFDPTARRYVMQTYRNGVHRPIVLTATDRGFEWRLKEKGNIRFKMTLTKDGRWKETGEFSADGKSWNGFLEMDLKRVSNRTGSKSR